MVVGADASPGDASGSATPPIRLCLYLMPFLSLQAQDIGANFAARAAVLLWFLGNRGWVLAAHERGVDEILGERPNLGDSPSENRRTVPNAWISLLCWCNQGWLLGTTRVATGFSAFFLMQLFLANEAPDAAQVLGRHVRRAGPGKSGRCCRHRSIAPTGNEGRKPHVLLFEPKQCQ
jgi:hypothetical protein